MRCWPGWRPGRTRPQSPDCAGCRGGPWVGRVSGLSRLSSTDGPPRHSTQSGDGGLVRPGRQPGQQRIEVAGQMRARTCEPDRLGDDAMIGTAKPPQRGADLDPPHAQVQMPPARRPLTGVVPPPCHMTAVRAHQPAPPQHDRDHDQRRQELDLSDVHPIETQQARECSRDAHGIVTSREPGFRYPEPWSRPVRVTRTLPTTRSPNKHKPEPDHPTHTRVRRAQNVGKRRLAFASRVGR